jgi:hypothetical protein
VLPQNEVFVSLLPQNGVFILSWVWVVIDWFSVIEFITVLHVVVRFGVAMIAFRVWLVHVTFVVAVVIATIVGILLWVVVIVRVLVAVGHVGWVGFVVWSRNRDREGSLAAVWK